MVDERELVARQILSKTNLSLNAPPGRSPLCVGDEERDPALHGGHPVAPLPSEATPDRSGRSALLVKRASSGGYASTRHTEALMPVTTGFNHVATLTTNLERHADFYN
jgi:hypothetical protein